MYNTIQSPYFLFAILCFSSAVKIRYIYEFAAAAWQKDVVVRPLLFLLLSISCALIGDISWLIKLAQSLFFHLPYWVLTFVIRLAWAALLLQYQSLSLFLQTLTNPNKPRSFLYYLTNGVTFLFSAYFIFLAFFKPFNYINREDRLAALYAGIAPEFFIMRYIVPALIGLFSIIGMFVAIKNIVKKDIPKIVRKQVRLFTLYFLMPYFLLEFVLATWFTSINEMLFVVSTSTLSLALAVYYCLHNVIKIRFVNTLSRVHGIQKPHVIDEFKNVLKELSNTTNMQELTHITQLFFKEAFGFSNQAVHLTIREQYPQEDKAQQSPQNAHAEHFITQQHELFQPTTGTPISLLVFDEIEFNNFYASTTQNKEVLSFLASIDADIFLPIYSNKSVVGYIRVDKGARQECINHSEQDALTAFATYLGNVINLLQHRNVQTLLYKEKKLRDALYTKHQEINHYK